MCCISMFNWTIYCHLVLQGFFHPGAVGPAVTELSQNALFYSLTLQMEVAYELPVAVHGPL